MERKQCTVATEMLTGYCTFTRHLEVMGLSSAGNVDRQMNLSITYSVDNQLWQGFCVVGAYRY